jgi:predicted Fe-S protein YdhL (DUF1289 family)
MSSAADSACPRVPSPCIRECCLDENNICLGCHRSLREICDWSDASDAERLKVLERCAKRRQERDSHAYGTDPFPTVHNGERRG